MRWHDPNWKEAAREYHIVRGNRPSVVEIDADHLNRLRQLLDDDVSIDRFWVEVNTIRGRAAWSTVEASAYQLRSAFSALSEPSAQRRLFEFSETQVRDIAKRLTRRPWSEGQIKALLKMWETGRENKL